MRTTALCALAYGPFAKALSLNMAERWEPTPDGDLSHVPKAQNIEALKEARPDWAAARWLVEPFCRMPG